MQYMHPILRRDVPSRLAGIFNTVNGNPTLEQETTRNKLETMGVEEFFERLRKDTELRVKLGIPPLAYHAYSFPPLLTGNSFLEIKALIEWARTNNREVRAWVNEDSYNLLIVITDSDLSEDSGWDLYEFVKANCPSKVAYGMSSWYEFCLFGIPIPDDWTIENRNSYLCVVAPGGEEIAFFG